MSNNDKGKARKNGWVLPGASVFGNKYGSLREELRKAGAEWSSRDKVWVFPSSAIYESFLARWPEERKTEPVKSDLPVSTVVALPVVTGPVAISLTIPKPPPPGQPVLPIVSTPPPAGSNGRSKTALQPTLPAVRPQVLQAVQDRQVEQPTSLGQPTEQPVRKLIDDARTGTGLLKLEPSRFAIITIPVASKGWSRPRRRRILDRKVELDATGNGFGTGTSAVKVTTKAEQLILNPEEHERAKRLQGLLGYQLRRLGTRVTDGVIVFPLKSEDSFDKARLDCKAMAAEFNKSSTHYEVRVDAFKLVAVVSDEEAIARQVAYEVQRLLNDMRSALEACDVERIRETAEAAKYKAAALAAGTARGALEAAVLSARKEANKIVKELQEKGQTIEAVRAKLELSAVDSARMTFLEFSVPVEVEASSGVDAGRFSELGGATSPGTPPDNTNGSGVETERFTTF